MTDHATNREPTDAGRPASEGHTGSVRWWRVGNDRVELTGRANQWSARVVRSAWKGRALDMAPGDRFDDEALALAWCRRMARVLGRDLEDEGQGHAASPDPIGPAARGNRLGEDDFT